jgi:hypothetical protein
LVKQRTSFTFYLLISCSKNFISAPHPTLSVVQTIELKMAGIMNWKRKRSRPLKRG